jgi:hypothetical protein
VKKKILGVFASFLFLLILITPALASPTKGNKVGITLTWTATNFVYLDAKEVGNTMHFHINYYWNVTLAIDDNGPKINGTAITDRYMTGVLQKDGGRLVVADYTEFSFPDDEGGFKGNSAIMMIGYIPIEPPVWQKSKAHGLFHGTGAFEGQTINAGNHWIPFDPLAESHVWYGYLLKPQL